MQNHFNISNFLAPAKPSSLSWTALSCSSVLVDWESPSENNDSISPIHKYILERREVGHEWMLVSDTTTTSYVDIGLDHR